jgi:acyl homoserine lactone synthase
MPGKETSHSSSTGVVAGKRPSPGTFASTNELAAKTPGSFRIARRKDFNRHELRDMHLLRARIFKDRMGWDVPVISEMEIDEFDLLDPYYMMISGPDNVLCGCWRLLPTSGPYMLRNIFPELLHGHSSPNDARVWELSRFAIMTGASDKFGFTGIAMEAMRGIVSFGDLMGIARYVTVTTIAIERMLRHANIAVERFGPPLRVGTGNIVALDIDLGEDTHRALFGGN